MPLKPNARKVTGIVAETYDPYVKLLGEFHLVFLDKGKGDGIFINTSGVGVLDHDLEIHPRSIRPGDAILINGDIGRHGIAIMATRQGLEFESQIESDCAPLNGPVQALLAGGVIMWLSGKDAIGAYQVLLNSALGTPRALANTLLPPRHNLPPAIALPERLVHNTGRVIPGQFGGILGARSAPRSAACGMKDSGIAGSSATAWACSRSGNSDGFCGIGRTVTSP